MTIMFMIFIYSSSIRVTTYYSIHFGSIFCSFIILMTNDLREHMRSKEADIQKLINICVLNTLLSGACARLRVSIGGVLECMCVCVCIV